MARLAYRLDELGWSGFEQLVQTLLKARLGLGVETWGGHGDWGRDAWFTGKLKYPTDAVTEGHFIFQCKFIEEANAAGAKSAKPLLDSVRKESVRIAANLRASDERGQLPTCYVLFTNAPLSAASRNDVRRILKNVLPETLLHVHDGQDVCQWLRLSPEVAASFPQFLSQWAVVQRFGIATFALLLVLGVTWAILCQREYCVQQQVVAGQTNLSGRIAGLEKLLSAQVRLERPADEPVPRLDLPRALREWAAQNNISPEQAQRELEAWIAEVRHGSTDLSERARAELLAQRFIESAELSDQAANEKLVRSKQLATEQKKLQAAAVDDLGRAGEALILGGNPGEALARYEQALRYVSRQESAVAWAQLQTALGRCHLGLAMSNTNDAAQQCQLAVSFFHDALDSFLGKQCLKDWAWTQGLLSSTRWWQATRVTTNKTDRNQLLGEAVKASRLAVGAYAQLHDLPHLQITKVLLVVALYDQAKQNDGQQAFQLYAETAKECREALMAFSWNGKDWEMMNGEVLSHSLCYQAERSPKPQAVRLFEQAAIAYRSALTSDLRERSPESWALYQLGLGKTLSKQAMLSNTVEKKQLLGKAESAYREALKVRSPTSTEIRVELAGMFAAQADQRDAADSERLLSKAAEDLRDIIRECSREESPVAWALARVDFAFVLAQQVKSLDEPGTEQRLSKAVAMCREAMAVFSREQFPTQWAGLQNKLGALFCKQAQRCDGAEARQLWSEARNAFSRSLEINTAIEFPDLHDIITHNLGEVDRALNGLKPKSE